MIGTVDGQLHGTNIRRYGRSVDSQGRAEGFTLPYFVVAMQRPVGKYLFDHPEIWEQNNQSRFDREPAFLAEVFRRYGSVERVLDVGCGTGGHLDRLSRLGLTGTGVDLNERMLDYARNAHPSSSTSSTPSGSSRRGGTSRRSSRFGNRSTCAT